MRNYLRHPASIAIEIAVVGELSKEVMTNNLSEGGLCFFTNTPVKMGAVVDLRIPNVREDYICEGVIVWQRIEKADEFEVGVKFTNDEDYFRVRMVEQICQIENYRKRLASVGRHLSSEAAAAEWIERYAADFDESMVSQ
jgi:hypothetical protein